MLREIIEKAARLKLKRETSENREARCRALHRRRR
jgi:hypothetical protein